MVSYEKIDSYVEIVQVCILVRFFSELFQSWIETTEIVLYFSMSFVLARLISLSLIQQQLHHLNSQLERDSRE